MAFLNTDKLTPACPNGDWETSSFSQYPGYLTSLPLCSLTYRTTAFFFEFVGAVSTKGSTWACSDDAGDSWTWFNAPANETADDAWSFTYLCAWSPNEAKQATYMIQNSPLNGSLLIVSNVSYGTGEMFFDVASAYTSTTEGDLKSLYISNQYSTTANPTTPSSSSAIKSSSGNSTAIQSTHSPLSPPSSAGLPSATATSAAESSTESSASSSSGVTSAHTVYYITGAIAAGILVVCVVAGICLKKDSKKKERQGRKAKKRKLRKVAKLARKGNDSDGTSGSDGQSDGGSSTLSSADDDQKKGGHREKTRPEHKDDTASSDSDTSHSSKTETVDSDTSETEDERRERRGKRDGSLGKMAREDYQRPFSQDRPLHLYERTGV